MFQKILIANRGEIAVRIIRACRDLGIPSVAVFSEADRAALHVRLADEAWPCGPTRASESYLVAPNLIAIARRAGADAIHPGYGFLSENAEFAARCEAVGTTFIGPPSHVIRAMGDKVTSRARMREANVPVVPGSDGCVSDDEALAAARSLGLPVIVKASGGGGGRGMRIVREEKNLLAATARARGEAAAAFGSDAIYLEKLLDRPRHIEVQILADQHGNVIHLFERECSIQRRHQKLIEEAPGNIDAAQRAALGATAVRAARAVGYVGAGTVEFLLDSAGRSYFLEMNTRIQVEHPVTEAVTSVDIVVEMIRVAAGEPLRLTQAEIGIVGHAIEARIYAEDPAKGFLPSPGVLEVFRPPSGPGVRVDAGVQAGDAVTPDYDALLAKVIAWGSDRAQAIDRLGRALAEFRVAGLATSIPFHRRVLGHEVFRGGRYDTGFVDEYMGGGKHAPQADDDGTLRVAVALLALSLHASSGAVALSILHKGGATFRTEIAATTTDPMRVAIDGEPLVVDAVRVGLTFSLIEDGRQREASVNRKRGDRFEVWVGECVYTLDVSPAAG